MATATKAVYREVWTGYINKSFKKSDSDIGWYNRAKSFDAYVDKDDWIHIVNEGAKPGVLVDNTTYPIALQTNDSDSDFSFKLNKFQTKRTAVSDDTLHAISYDRMALVLEQHRDAITDKRYEMALHAVCPASTATTKIFTATGTADSAGRNTLKREDLLKLKKLFDSLLVPLNDRVLVLCSDHVNDLLAQDQAFRDQYYNYQSGKILNLYGFDVYESPYCPYAAATGATAGAKVAVGTAPTSTDSQVSVAFVASKVLRADGSLKMYYLHAEQNPSYQQSEVNFKKYSIFIPMQDDACAMIYSPITVAAD